MPRAIKDKKASRLREAFSLLPAKRAPGRWRCGEYLLDYRKRPLVMGILNVTPDSFSDGGLFFEGQKAIDQGLRFEAEGADLIDIGGESTRPGALEVPMEEESRRVLPIIATLAKRIRIPLSIDTRKAEIARRAIEAGASIINDVSGFRHDPGMFPLACQGKTGMVIMHSKGTPQTMQTAPRYRSVVQDIYLYLQKQLVRAMRSGISNNRIAIDPGIGFGKTARHNLAILHHLNTFSGLGAPVLVGPSRKSFIGNLLALPPLERLEGTAAAAAIAVFQGARILRIHDVASMKRVVLVSEGIRKKGFV
ncbi:MAG: dihydropteroate synthase [Nitrospiria bacterium]